MCWDLSWGSVAPEGSLLNLGCFEAPESLTAGGCLLAWNCASWSCASWNCGEALGLGAGGYLPAGTCRFSELESTGSHAYAKALGVSCCWHLPVPPHPWAQYLPSGLLRWGLLLTCWDTTHHVLLPFHQRERGTFSVNPSKFFYYKTTIPCFLLTQLFRAFSCGDIFWVFRVQ